MTEIKAVDGSTVRVTKLPELRQQDECVSSPGQKGNALLF